jgi:hypothetical protein
MGKEHPPLPLTRELGDWIWRSEDPATWVVVVPVVVSAMISTGFGATQNAIVSAMRCFPSKKAAHGDDLIFPGTGEGVKKVAHPQQGSLQLSPGLGKTQEAACSRNQSRERRRSRPQGSHTVRSSLRDFAGPL